MDLCWQSNVSAFEHAACCDSRGRKESDTTERLIWSDKMKEFTELNVIASQSIYRSYSNFYWTPNINTVLWICRFIKQETMKWAKIHSVQFSSVAQSCPTLCMRWPKYWSFSFSISPSNEHPGLISFRMDWLDLIAVQGTLKSLLQHHSSKASILRCSAFFTVQLSHPYMEKP